MRAANRYRQTQATTSSPEEVLLLLYDGAIRFAEEAVEHFENEKFGAGGQRIGRVMAIVAEFQSSLDHKKAPDLCSTLDGLYSYMTNKLLEANRNQDIEALNEVMELLGDLRDTWRDAAGQARQEQAGGMKAAAGGDFRTQA